MLGRMSGAAISSIPVKYMRQLRLVFSARYRFPIAVNFGSERQWQLMRARFDVENLADNTWGISIMS